MSQGKLLELGVVFYSNAIYHHSYYSQMSEIVEDLLSTGVNQDSFFETMSSCSVGKFIPLFSSTKLYSSCKKKKFSIRYYCTRVCNREPDLLQACHFQIWKWKDWHLF